jgi:hypothetical protein
MVQIKLTMSIGSSPLIFCNSPRHPERSEGSPDSGTASVAMMQRSEIKVYLFKTGESYPS